MKKRLLIGLGIALVLMFVARTIHVRAQGDEFEVLYLSDSGPWKDGKTKLFSVELDSITGHSNLTLLPDAGYGPGRIPLEQADSLACTPDGRKLYAINKLGGYRSGGNAKMGYYEIGTALWHEVGVLNLMGVPVKQIGQAAFSPDGTLYVGSDLTDYLYIVDKDTAEATVVGDIKKDGMYKVNVSGADLIFAADGTLYLWANTPYSGAPRGLYILTLPTSMPGTINAVYLGASGVGDYFTGMAIRDNGTGDLVGSTHDNRIFLVDKTNGLTLGTFWMYLGGSPYSYEYGDMTVGPFVFCTRTIGYWKNHSWNGETVIICGVEVSENGTINGMDILWGARGKDHSMLFAQLIAAKLNCGNCVGIPAIDEAESYICTKWSTSWPFQVHDSIPKQDKDYVSGLWEALNAFNNMYECEED